MKMFKFDLKILYNLLKKSMTGIKVRNNTYFNSMSLFKQVSKDGKKFLKFKIKRSR